MLDPLLKNLLQGITVIEDEFGSINRMISKQLGAYAVTNGKKVCFLEPPSTSGVSSVLGSAGEFTGFEMPSDETLENTGAAAQQNSVVYRTEERYLPLEQLKFDMIVFHSFSSYVFAMSEKEVAELMEEIVRLSRQGKSFVLTSETPMLNDRVNAYIRASSDTVIIVRVEIGQNKINRTLYIPKMFGVKTLDRLIKVTVEDDGVDIDTREMIG